MPANSIFEETTPRNKSKSLLRVTLRNEDLCLAPASNYEELSFITALLSSYFADNKHRKSREAWLVGIALPVSQSVIATKFSALALDLDDDLYVYVDDKEARTVEIYEVYKISSGGEAIVLPFGRWFKDRGLLSTETAAKYDRRRDMRARVKKGASINDVHKILGVFDPLPLVRLWN